MGMSKHTPGPWNLDTTTLEITTRDDVEARIAMIDGDNCDWSQAEADARLITAAPDMLEALKSTARGLEGEFGPRVAEVNFPALYAAIAKAQGAAQ